MVQYWLCITSLTISAYSPHYCYSLPNQIVVHLFSAVVPFHVLHNLLGLNLT